MPGAGCSRRVISHTAGPGPAFFHPRSLPMPDRAAVKAYLLDLQARIVAALEAFDGKPFVTDSWTRPAGGGGPPA